MTLAGGRQIKRVTDETVFGSRTRLAVVAGRGEWLQVSTETAGDRRRAWIRASDVRLRDTGYRLVVSAGRARPSWVDGSRVVFRTRVAVGSTAQPDAHRPVQRHRQARGPPLRQRLRLLHPRDLRRPGGKLPANWPGGNRIALHGTNSPASLGQPVSTGCVRVAERRLRRLMRKRPPRDARDDSGLNRYPTPRTVCTAPARSPSLRRETGDRDVDHVRAARPLVAPDVAQERVPRHGLALAVDQVAHHVALELRQRDPVAVEPQLAGTLVEGGGRQVEVARGERGTAS